MNRLSFEIENRLGRAGMPFSDMNKLTNEIHLALQAILYPLGIDMDIKVVIKPKSDKDASK